LASIEARNASRTRNRLPRHLNNVVIGLDVGTTATKAALVDNNGNILALVRRTYGLLHPAPGHVEQSPVALWHAVLECLRELANQGGHMARAIGVSTQGATLILLRGSRPLCPAITWLDSRAVGVKQAMLDEYGTRFFLKRLGYPHPGLGAPLLCWLATHRAALFKKATRFAYVNDFITGKLTGRFVSDPTNVSISGFLNLQRQDWSDEILGLAGITRDRVSEVQPSGVPVGTLSRAVARATGLSPQTVVAAPVHDQYAATLGAGVTDMGQMLLSCGTAWVLLMVTDRPVRDRDGGIYPGPHVIPDRYGAMVAMSNGSVVWDWLRRILGENEEDFRTLEHRLQQVPAGARGVVMIPCFGESGVGAFPFHRGGMLTGLSLPTSRDDLLRACMEGLALETRWGLERLQRLGAHCCGVTMIGGAAGSRLWPQIVADALNVPVQVPEECEAACLGAALLATVTTAGTHAPHGLRSLARQWAAARNRLLYRPRRHEAYHAAYAAYVGIRRHIKHA